jgi:cephalosporin-C deacetylase-like acetyl esterase
MVTVGFIDNACHPSGVYAAYNALPGEKYILNCLESGHSGLFNYTRHRAPMYGWLQNRMSRGFR